MKINEIDWLELINICRRIIRKRYTNFFPGRLIYVPFEMIEELEQKLNEIEDYSNER